VVTVPNRLQVKRIPAWLSPGSIYRERDVAAWAETTEDYEVVSVGSISLEPAHGDPLPVYEVRPVE
jgi:hypothetical protein